MGSNPILNKPLQLYRYMQLPENYCFHIQASLYASVSENHKNTIEFSQCYNTTPFLKIEPNFNVFEHPKFLELRKKTSLEGACVNCSYEEDVGIRCPIKRSAHREFTEPLYNLTGPILLRLNLDTTCNIACTICSPNYSSKWRSEEKIKSNPSVSGKTISDFFDNLDCTNLQKVQILGGEPFLSKHHRLILEKLLPYKEKLTISYNTNGTVRVSSDIIELWKEFKQITIRFSIDAIGMEFNYLRWPAKWDDVESNLYWYRDLKLKNCKFVITPTIGILNIFSMTDLKMWYAKHFKKDHFDKMIIFDPTPTDFIFALKGISQSMIDAAREEYKNQPLILQYIPEVETSNVLDFVKKELLNFDKKRNLDYKTYLPKLVKFLPN